MTTIPPDILVELKQRVYEPMACLIEVRNVLGPYLNEYMYQDALAIEFRRRGLFYEREYSFSVDYKGEHMQHKHYVDFMFGQGDARVIVECKAVEKLTTEHRQQLWNYMRLTGVEVGMLYNFAPVKAQMERYYLPPNSPSMIAF